MRNLRVLLIALCAQAASAAPVPAADPVTRDGPNGLLWLIFAIALMVLIAQIKKGWDWAHRPERLCLGCRSVKQPNRYTNKRYYCPICSADNPVPLESPAAREYFALHGGAPPARR